MGRYSRLLVAIICIAISYESFTQEGLQDVYKAGMAAYENANYQEFLAKMERANELRSDHPTILYNLSVAYALTGDKSSSVETLRKVLWMNAELPYDSDKDLVPLNEYTPFEELKKEVEELKAPISNGNIAFEIEDKELHPEGVAYSANQEKFFVGGVHSRKILSISKDGKIDEFASGENLMAIMGLQVDNERNLLWACSTPAPEMVSFKEGMTAELLSFDLETGRLVGSYPAPHAEAWLGDLTIASDGMVYVTSSSAEKPAIYVFNKENKSLEILVEPKELISLQGLALNTDETVLYFADYRFGLFRYDLRQKNLTHLSPKVNHPVKGIDGLYFYKDDLIAIHNGLKPVRIVRYELNRAGNEILDYTFLEKAVPGMDEPTLGVIIRDELYYVFNSPWGAYDENKELQVEQVDNPKVRMLKIEK